MKSRLPAVYRRVPPLGLTHEQQVRDMWKNILTVSTRRRGTTVYDTFGTFIHTTPESIRFLLTEPSQLAMERGDRKLELRDRKVFVDAYLSSASAVKDDNYPSVVMEMSAGGKWVGTALMVVRNSGLLVLPQIWPLGDELRQVVETMSRTKGTPELTDEQSAGDVLAVSLANAILGSRGSPWELTSAAQRDVPVCIAEYGKEGLKTYHTFTRTSAIYVPFRTPAFSPLSLEATAMSAIKEGTQGVPSYLADARESQKHWSEPQRIGDEHHTERDKGKHKPKGHHPHKTFLHSALAGKSHADTTQKLFASQAAATREREPIGDRWRRGGRWRGGRGWFSAVAPLLYPPPPPVVIAAPPPPVVMVPPALVPLPLGMPPEAVLYDPVLGLPPGWMLLENNYRIPIGARYPRNLRVLRREPRHRPPVREEQHEVAAPRPEEDPEYISKLREMQRIGEDLSIIRERIAKRAGSTPQKP